MYFLFVAEWFLFLFFFLNKLLFFLLKVTVIKWIYFQTAFSFEGDTNTYHHNAFQRNFCVWQNRKTVLWINFVFVVRISTGFNFPAFLIHSFRSHKEISIVDNNQIDFNHSSLFTVKCKLCQSTKMYKHVYNLCLAHRCRTVICHRFHSIYRK